MHNKTLTELAAGLRSKQFSSVELTQAFLQRINQYQALNAFVTVSADVALQQAQLADNLLAAGNVGPLTGIPVAQKDIFCTQGIKTVAALKCWTISLPLMTPRWSVNSIRPERCYWAN